MYICDDSPPSNILWFTLSTPLANWPLFHLLAVYNLSFFICDVFSAKIRNVGHSAIVSKTALKKDKETA